MINKTLYTEDFLPHLDSVGDYILTKSGTLLAFFEVEMFDPDGMFGNEYFLPGNTIKKLLSQIDYKVEFYQYHIHYPQEDISLKKRKRKKSNELNDNHQNKINNSNLNKSRIIYCLEFDSGSTSHNYGFADYIISMVKSLYSKDDRNFLKNSFSLSNQIEFSKNILFKAQKIFDEKLSRIESILNVNDTKVFKFSLLDSFHFLSFLITLDSKYLSFNIYKELPKDHFYLSIEGASIEPKYFNGEEFLLYKRTKQVFSSIGTITRIIGSFKHDFWVKNNNSILASKGNFLLVNYWHNFSPVKDKLFHSFYKKQIKRQSFNPMDMIFSGQKEEKSEKEFIESLRPDLKRQYMQLINAQSLDETWGEAFFHVIPFNENIDKLLETREELDNKIIAAGANIKFEQAGLLNACESIIPGNGNVSVRKLPLNSSQFATMSQHFKSSTGFMEVPYLNGDEPRCFFETSDGQLFGYSPFVGKKSLVIGVGPIGSGKSFFKNFTACHFLKYGGKSFFLDMDRGSYPVHKFFDDESNYFEYPNMGMNPFFKFPDGYKEQFINNMFHLLLLLIKTNKEDKLSVLESGEQLLIEEYIIKILDMDAKFHTFNYLIEHFPQELKSKFASFIRGKYRKIFNSNSLDMTKDIACFNLINCKDDKDLLKIMQHLILFQITAQVENETTRYLPKLVEIDEAHNFIDSKESANFIVKKSREWRKYFGSIGLWTQNAIEFKDLKHWPAVKQAVSTYLFFPDPQIMDEKELYKDVFGLRDSDLYAIESLQSMKEVYIIQPEIGVSKKIAFNPDKFFLDNFSSNPNTENNYGSVNNA